MKKKKSAKKKNSALKSKISTQGSKVSVSAKKYLFLTIFSIIVGCATGDIADNPLPTEAQIAAAAKEAQEAGAATPTPSPESTPAPTPSPESTPAPTPSPESTPAPTPSPESTPAPTPSPESTPAPTPSPESTSAQTTGPESTPVPTPSPESTTMANPSAEATSTAVNVSESATAAPTGVVAEQAVISKPTVPAVDDATDLKTYKVKKYDTLMRISFKIYGDPYGWDDIFQLNKEMVNDPNHIVEGMELKYKPPVGGQKVAKQGHKYTIKPGDTLSLIALEVYGNAGKWQSIWEKNNDVIHNPAKIMAGLVIYYSGGRANLASRLKSKKENETAKASGDPEQVQDTQSHNASGQSAGTLGNGLQPPPAAPPMESGALDTKGASAPETKGPGAPESKADVTPSDMSAAAGSQAIPSATNPDVGNSITSVNSGPAPAH